MRICDFSESVEEWNKYGRLDLFSHLIKIKEDKSGAHSYMSSTFIFSSTWVSLDDANDFCGATQITIIKVRQAEKLFSRGDLVPCLVVIKNQVFVETR